MVAPEIIRPVVMIWMASGVGGVGIRPILSMVCFLEGHHGPFGIHGGKGCLVVGVVSFFVFYTFLSQVDKVWILFVK